jgi:hypothetical protein
VSAGAVLLESEPVSPRVPLGDVPAVLLSECWNDTRSIAALGSGFEADWKKKTGW